MTPLTPTHPPDTQLPDAAAEAPPPPRPHPRTRRKFAPKRPQRDEEPQHHHQQQQQQHQGHHPPPPQQYSNPWLLQDQVRILEGYPPRRPDGERWLLAPDAYSSLKLGSRLTLADHRALLRARVTELLCAFLQRLQEAVRQRGTLSLCLDEALRRTGRGGGLSATRRRKKPPQRRRRPSWLSDAPQQHRGDALRGFDTLGDTEAEASFASYGEATAPLPVAPEKPPATPPHVGKAVPAYPSEALLGLGEMLSPPPPNFAPNPVESAPWGTAPPGSLGEGRAGWILYSGSEWNYKNRSRLERAVQGQVQQQQQQQGGSGEQHHSVNHHYFTVLEKGAAEAARKGQAGDLTSSVQQGSGGGGGGGGGEGQAYTHQQVISPEEVSAERQPYLRELLLLERRIQEKRARFAEGVWGIVNSGIPPPDSLLRHYRAGEDGEGSGDAADAADTAASPETSLAGSGERRPGKGSAGRKAGRRNHPAQAPSGKGGGGGALEREEVIASVATNQIMKTLFKKAVESKFRVKGAKLSKLLDPASLTKIPPGGAKRKSVSPRKPKRSVGGGERQTQHDPPQQHQHPPGEVSPRSIATTLHDPQSPRRAVSGAGQHCGSFRAPLRQSGGGGGGGGASPEVPSSPPPLSPRSSPLRSPQGSQRAQRSPSHRGVQGTSGLVSGGGSPVGDAAAATDAVRLHSPLSAEQVSTEGRGGGESEAEGGVEEEEEDEEEGEEEESLEAQLSLLQGLPGLVQAEAKRLDVAFFDGVGRAQKAGLRKDPALPKEAAIKQGMRAALEQDHAEDLRRKGQYVAAPVLIRRMKMQERMLAELTVKRDDFLRQIEEQKSENRAEEYRVSDFHEEKLNTLVAEYVRHMQKDSKQRKCDQEVQCRITVIDFETERRLKALSKREGLLKAEAANFKALLVHLDAFFESADNAVTCRACFATLEDPVGFTPCGHSVCLACLPGLTVDAQSVRCPDCNRLSHEKPMPNHSLGLLLRQWFEPGSGFEELRGKIAKLGRVVEEIESTIQKWVGDGLDGG